MPKYINNFDEELVDYIEKFLNSVGITNLLINSTPMGYDFTSQCKYVKIRFEIKNSFVLQLYYEDATEKHEAQIRITSIVINPPLKGTGISKGLLKTLLEYCTAHNDMSLWIFDLINKTWIDYLIKHGAVLVQEETLDAGAVLWIKTFE